MTRGTPERPLRVAIVGAGPSGFYAADALFKSGLDVAVDVFDRLPTPFGLVRGGVAPDHQTIKKVVAVYERIAKHPKFRFFGHTRLGADVSVATLARHYDARIYAVGAEADRRLGIPGEDLPGSLSATAFVGWYNGHPNHQAHPIDLGCARAAVVGVGNVALDVTRILVSDPEVLATTDIADHALAALRASKVREVVLLGRRSAAEAAFSPQEIEEIADLPGVDVVVDPAEVVPSEASGPLDAQAAKNLAWLQAQAAKGEGTNPRKVRLRFLRSPYEIEGTDRVTALHVERNVLGRDAAGRPVPHGTGEVERIEVGLVFRSVGYLGVPIPGVPFDHARHRIPNRDGRVLDEITGEVRVGEYVVGWAKRGPTGLVGTNRGDAAGTVALLVADVAGWPDRDLPDPHELTDALAATGHLPTSWDDWGRIDAAERERGGAAGKIREKYVDIAAMLDAAKP